MTSELRPAVEVWRDAYDAFTDFYHHTTEKDPARVIEADREAVRAEQAAEIERLREALRQYVYETTSLSPREDDGSHWCKISANCLSNARAALAGDSHDQ